jgi:hypothetical protein
MVAEGTKVVVGGTGVGEVGDAQETIRKVQTKNSPTLDVICESMELILLDLGLSLNNSPYTVRATLQGQQGILLSLGGSPLRHVKQKYVG